MSELPAKNLAGGWVLVAPSAAGVIARALAAAENQTRVNGYPPPPDFTCLMAVFAHAVAEQQTPAAPGRSEVPRQREVAASAVSVRMVLADPVSAEQAAAQLGCTARNVRDLCARGSFETAQRSRAGWEIERAEVADRAKAQDSAASPARGGSRNAGYWARADQQARR